MKRSVRVGLLVLMIGAVRLLYAQSAENTLVVPGFTAYSEPDPEAVQIESDDDANANTVRGWADAKTTIAWYGLIRTAGKLDVSVRLHLPAGSTSKLSMSVDGRRLKAITVHGADGSVVASFGTYDVKETGGHRFALDGLAKTGADFGEIEALVLGGAAVKDAMFNLTRQRGAPSVHLNFAIPDGVQAKWFYNEVTVKKDPIWSYYEACGFSRGYFGIQVNSPTERRIIFSVWDSGEEPTDRGKVAQQDRVQLLQKGPGVFAGDFGNEGTGGHSHLVYPWKTGETYRFLVSAQPDGANTIYTGYFYFPEKKAWGLIASFRAPKDGGYLTHLYSFNEDFSGANGQQLRLAEFGNQWIKTTDDKWMELTKARFTHTARGQYKDRLDRGAGVAGDKFYLTNGGFKPESIEFGDEIQRQASGQAPDVTLPTPESK